ncbi:MAG: restriction endonuclease subunit S [Bacilli bacterium]
MKYKLKELCIYENNKILVSNLDKEEYISTENMVSNFGGTNLASSIPISGKATKFEKNMILISNIRPYFKKMIFAELEGGCSNDVLVLKKNSEKVNDKFLFYSLLNNDFFNYIMSTSKGTKMPRGDKSAIMEYEINVPEYNIQGKIVKFIEYIDNHIKNNNETNNNLSEISQNLYKRWFINFEFPNQDGKPYKSSGGKMVGSELGMIPENWEVGFIDDGKLTKIIKSGVAKFKKEKKYIATADVEKTTMKSFTFIDYNSKPSRANMTPIPNSIWFAKMQDSVKNMMVASYMNNILDNYIFSTGFMGIECLKNSMFYIWNYINSDAFFSLKNNLSTGTLMAGISNTTIVGCKYVIPTESILNLFNNEMQKTNESIYNNEQENIVLEKLRDTLLPKLMNGEIDLVKIEI